MIKWKCRRCGRTQVSLKKKPRLRVCEPCRKTPEELTADQMRKAFQRQAQRMISSMAIDRTGWTDEQWVEDARRLMGESDGAITSLLNGHALAMLNTIDKLKKERKG